MAKKRARDVIRSVLKEGKIQFANRGAQCPACKYTYTNGLTDVSTHVRNGAASDSKLDAVITVCTRCRRTLVLEPTGLRLLNDIEYMLLSAPELEAINTLRDIARAHTQDKS